jgi:divalent metal cation (Fe/Co/Zn/Cd) transporter
MSSVQPSEQQIAREWAIIFALILDGGMVVSMVLIGVLGGSLTILAEALRGGLGNATECFTVVLLRRIHRHTVVAMDYGTGKLEEVVSVIIAASMLLAAGWVSLNVWRLTTGQREIGTPLGLACAAIIGFINLYVNVLAWDAVRRAMAGGHSIIMESQLRLRTTKLVSSIVVSAGLTIAALSTDDVIVEWADGLGGLFVAVYMIIESIIVLRSSIPDLLDRSAGDSEGAIRQVLEARGSEYEEVRRVRSRRAGHTTFIEIDLGFDRTLPLGEVQRRTESLRTAISGAVADADVSIVASVAGWPRGGIP